MSSFQLHDTPSLRPDVGVLTNLSPDHLDRYASVAEYYADKKRLFANAGARSQWVVNRDDPAALDLASGAAGTHWHFSVRGADAHAWYDRAGDRLVVLGAPLAPRPSLALLGDHNVANALAAALAVMVAAPAHRTDEARRALADGLNDFRALKHRLEPVATSGRSGGGVQWINDSKATNVSATLVALAGMTRPTILLLGGRHKGEPYTVLGEQLRRVGKRVLAYGEAAPLIERDLAGVAAVERMGSDFGAVIARARALAEPGDVVLLSPACSSFDMFKNYEERGEEFKRLAGQGTEY
jgi:UDP-N-acetylmuramoylalanine--D-glutamate ligase